MNKRTSLQYTDHPAPFEESSPKNIDKGASLYASRLDKSAEVYNLLTEKEQRACNMATD